MSNQRLPNEDDVRRVSDTEELVDLHAAPGLQEEAPTASTLPANEEEEEDAADVVASSSEASGEKSSSSSSNTGQETDEESIVEEGKLADEEKQITEQDAAKQEQQVAPTMSPEQVLLLQVLRRAKRQQDLIIEVQKNLKSLTNIQKGIERTIERAKEKEFAKLRTQKRGGGGGGALISAKGKTAKNRGKRKKLR